MHDRTDLNARRYGQRKSGRSVGCCNAREIRRHLKEMYARIIRATNKMHANGPIRSEASFVSGLYEMLHSGRTTSILNEKKRVKSNICRTTGGQLISNNRMPTKLCIPVMNTFIPATTDRIGGNSMDDDIPTKITSATKANPSSNGSWPCGQR